MFISTYTSIYSYIAIDIRLGTHAHTQRQRARERRERRGEENTQRVHLKLFKALSAAMGRSSQMHGEPQWLI